MDALNINNSLLTSLTKDLQTSLQPFSPFSVSNANGSVLTAQNNWSLGDYSNFMIGIPFCDSEDFYGGISTSGTIQIELSGERIKPENDYALIEYRATAICFEDALLKIEITNASIKKKLLMLQLNKLP